MGYSKPYRLRTVEEREAAMRREKALHRERIKAAQPRGRQQTVEAYGGKCACCGEDNPVFLCIDHVNGGGNAHRRELGRKRIYWWLRQQDYPDGYRILCWNCNYAVYRLGACPHANT